MFAVLECLENDEPPVSIHVFDDYDAAYEDFVRLAAEDLRGCTIVDDADETIRKSHPHNGEPQCYTAGEYYVSLHTSGVTLHLSKAAAHG